jgi:hypothetical protein
MLKKTVIWIAKVFLCGLAYYAGAILGGMLAGQIGLTAPSIPEGTDARTLGLLMLVAGFFFAGVLASVARGLEGRFPTRWLTLSLLIWAAYSLNTYLEASIFSPQAGSSFTVVTELVASLLGGAAVAWLFPSPAVGRPIWAAARAFFGGRSVGQWAWRFAAALAAFPAAYVTFGTLISPLVIAYYERAQFGLSLPGWGQILPTQFLRSLVFLLACLPVLVAWRRSQRALFVTLGIVLFIFVGGAPMVVAYWYPSTIRIVHSLEILADSLVHAGALVLLLVKPERSSA